MTPDNTAVLDATGLRDPPRPKMPEHKKAPDQRMLFEGGASQRELTYST
ncbi:hypothetical protein [Nocardia xishanensis]